MKPIATDADALEYAIDFLRAFQPKREVDKWGRDAWSPPGMEQVSRRQRWEAAMERLEAMQREARGRPTQG
jgi:hypothetical protein